MIKVKNLIQQDMSQEKVMSMTIKNPETGNDVTVSSALSYDKSSAVYKAAKKLVDKNLYHGTKYTDDVLYNKFSKLSRDKQTDYIKKLDQKSDEYIKQVELEKYNQNFTDDQADAINVYTSEKYQDINRYLRTGQGFKKEYQPILKKINSAMSKNKLQHDVITYRGISTAQFMPRQGEVFEQKGFASTSPHIYSAYSFSRGENKYMVKINVKRGTPAVYIGGGQKQLLLGSDTKFKVKKIDNDKRFIELQVV